MSFVATAAVVVGASTAIAGSIQANKAAGKADAYNAEVTRLQNGYRLDVMHYGNSAYANDISFYNKQIAWEKEEFEKNKTRAQDAVTSINSDFFGKLATQMTKMVEQNMAESLAIIDTATQVRSATGTVEARLGDAGYGGNNAALLRGDIARQGGNADTITGMNADAQRRQGRIESQNLRATRDNQLSQLTIPTFQPLQAPAPPAPVSPVNPSPPSTRQGIATIALNAVSSGINLGIGVNSLIK